MLIDNSMVSEHLRFNVVIGCNIASVLVMIKLNFNIRFPIFIHNSLSNYGFYRSHTLIFCGGYLACQLYIKVQNIMFCCKQIKRRRVEYEMRKALNNQGFAVFFGCGSYRIRTCDPLLVRQML